MKHLCLGKKLWVRERGFSIMVWDLHVAHNGQSELLQFILLCACVSKSKMSQWARRLGLPSNKCTLLLTCSDYSVASVRRYVCTLNTILTSYLCSDLGIKKNTVFDFLQTDFRNCLINIKTLKWPDKKNFSDLFFFFFRKKKQSYKFIT